MFKQCKTGACVVCIHSEGIWDEENVGCEEHGGIHNNYDVCEDFKEYVVNKIRVCEV